MKKHKLIAGLIILLIAPTQWIMAQQNNSTYMSSKDWSLKASKAQKVEKGAPLKEVLSLIETTYDVNFLFDANLLVGKNIEQEQVLHFKNGLFSILDILLPPFNVTYKQLTHRTLGILFPHKTFSLWK